ncbi:hypothetical protein GIY23_14300 [Allosaccharopolyspora coralli]|uniref:SRPBCC family protein n=1 Tax=Allosaccharopolyspora coralli TaxID=2665642 RepID=A0A5Q3QI68_9PSEU|nr:hypothetical protein [Allosaccharopolyspora coralli]QGK70537.1 hypothetical protein GIY23_14300 [Allosaccharopolyspora coralli]
MSWSPATALATADDTRIVESVELPVPRATVREELKETATLTATVPGLRRVQWRSPRWMRCEIDLPGLPHVHDLRIESTASRSFVAWHSETPPKHQARLDLTPLRDRTRLTLRIRVGNQSTASPEQLTLLMREFLFNLRSRLETSSGVPPRAGHDPLLHTGLKVPPDGKQRNQSPTGS